MKIKVISVYACKVPPNEVDPDDPITNPTPTLRKISRDETLLDCNLTTKKFGPANISFRSYQLLPNAQRNLMFKLERVTCANPMTFKIVKLLDITMSKDCTVAAGNYHFENLNINSFGWLLSKTITVPGKYGVELIFRSPKGVVACTFLTTEFYIPKKIV